MRQIGTWLPLDDAAASLLQVLDAPLGDAEVVAGDAQQWAAGQRGVARVAVAVTELGVLRTVRAVAEGELLLQERPLARFALTPAEAATLAPVHTEEL